MIDNSHPAIERLRKITEEISKERDVSLEVKLHEKDNPLGKTITIKLESKYGDFLSFTKFFATKDIILNSEEEQEIFFDQIFQSIIKEGIYSYYGKHLLKLN